MKPDFKNLPTNWPALKYFWTFKVILNEEEKDLGEKQGLWRRQPSILTDKISHNYESQMVTITSSLKRRHYVVNRVKHSDHHLLCGVHGF